MKNLYVKCRYVVFFLLIVTTHQLNSQLPPPPGHIERYYDETGALHLRWVDHLEHEVDKYFLNSSPASPQSMIDLQRHMGDIREEMVRRIQQQSPRQHICGAAPILPLLTILPPIKDLLIDNTANRAGQNPVSPIEFPLRPTGIWPHAMPITIQIIPQSPPCLPPSPRTQVQVMPARSGSPYEFEFKIPKQDFKDCSMTGPN